MAPLIPPCDQWADCAIPALRSTFKAVKSIVASARGPSPFRVGPRLSLCSPTGTAVPVLYRWRVVADRLLPGRVFDPAGMKSLAGSVRYQYRLRGRVSRRSDV